jgi:hypothetical protein
MSCVREDGGSKVIVWAGPPRVSVRICICARAFGDCVLPDCMFDCCVFAGCCCCCCWRSVRWYRWLLMKLSCGHSADSA